MGDKRRKRLKCMPLQVLSRWCILAFWGWAALGANADSSVNVALDHWVYGYLQRLETEGKLSIDVGGIKPFTRNEVAIFVKELSEGCGCNLSPIQKAELDLLRDEFAAELGPRGHGQEGAWGSRLRKGHPLLQYRSKGGELLADLLWRQQSDRLDGRQRKTAETVYRNRVGGIVRGAFGNQIGFRLAFEQLREQGARDYTYRHDVFERRLELPQLKGNLADSHEGTAYLAFALGPVNVQVGKDEAAWGPAPGQNLGLGSNAPSFNLVRLKSRLGAFRLVALSGELQPCPDRPDSPLCRGLADSSATYITNGISRRLDRKKYLAAHRLEVALAPWLDLGFQEVVVYGDRGPELSYANPLMFYWAAQSYLGDKDNVMMGLDLDIHPGRGRRYYLAYVVDDLKKAGILSDDFANKFSLQVGFEWANPLGWGDADLRLEYVRIEPWIYSHKFPINTFRHFDVPLGHPLGPNSDQWQILLVKRASRDLSFEAGLRRNRHGANVFLRDGTILNVGGDMHYGWRPGDERESKAFLAGRLARRTEISGGVRWRILPLLVAAAEYRHEWGTGVPLPPAAGPGVPLAWRTGYGDGVEQHLRFDLRYNYF